MALALAVRSRRTDGGYWPVLCGQPFNDFEALAGQRAGHRNKPGPAPYSRPLAVGASDYPRITHHLELNQRPPPSISTVDFEFHIR
jgi:hypothetical protein